MTRFFVPGVPCPQGSKTPWGTEANPGTKPWREAVRSAALEHRRYSRELLAGPVRVTCVFSFPRPKNHFRTGKYQAELKPAAPCWKASKPDVDKLLRAILDALTGVVWTDDCQVVDVRGVKGYSSRPGVDIRIGLIEQTLPSTGARTEAA